MRRRILCLLDVLSISPHGFPRHNDSEFQKMGLTCDRYFKHQRVKCSNFYYFTSYQKMQWQILLLYKLQLCLKNTFKRLQIPFSSYFEMASVTPLLIPRSSKYQGLICTADSTGQFFLWHVATNSWSLCAKTQNVHFFSASKQCELTSFD